jgi:tRNA (cmo5U34)-methyltransferase
VKEKSFDSGERYNAEISRLVPGYPHLHSMLPMVLEAHVPREGRILVVGCGTGHELVSLARAFPDCVIDGVDPSEAMVRAARSALREAGVVGQVEVECSDSATGRDYDVVLAVLVGHLIPFENGRRRDFYAKSAKALVTGGRAIFVEPIRRDDYEEQGEAHVAWSRENGLSPDRLEELRARMSSGFYVLSPETREELMSAAGFAPPRSFFQSFSIEGWQCSLEA